MLAVRHANPFIIGQCFESLSIEGHAATGCSARWRVRAGQCCVRPAETAEMRAALRRDVCRRDLFDLEPVHAPVRNRSPTSSPELRHNRNRRRDGMNRTQLLPSHLPRGRKAAAEVRGPRPHRSPQECSARSETRGAPPWFAPNGRCGTRASLQKFDSARVCDARRTGRIRSLR